MICFTASEFALHWLGGAFFGVLSAILFVILTRPRK
jgi:hypothetical protein